MRLAGDQTQPAPGERPVSRLQEQPDKLAGQRFGNLVCVEPTGERAPDRSVYWRCRCDYGREITAPANKLRYGRYTSCGCRKAARLQESNGMIDSTNARQVLSDTVRVDNTSGYPGVYRKRGSWSAQIQYKKKSITLASSGARNRRSAPASRRKRS